MREHQRRTRSPPRPRYRDRETEENRRLCLNRTRDESHWFRAVGSGARHHDVNDDDDNNVYARKLSQFSESLPKRELTSKKFEWANLLANKPGKSDSGRILTENDNVVGFNSSKKPNSLCPTAWYYDCSKNDAVLPSGIYYRGVHEKPGFFSKDGLVPCTRTDLHAESVAREGNFEQTRVSNPSAMPPCFSSMEGAEQRSEIYPLYKSMASVGDEYRAQNTLRTSIVDSIVDKLDGTENSESRQMEHNLDFSDQCVHVREESFKMDPEGEYSGSRISQMSKGSEEMELDEECIGSVSGSGSRNFHVECGLDVNLDNRGLLVGEDFVFRRDARLAPYEEGLKRLNQDVLYGNEDRSQQMLVEEELTFKDQSEKVLKRGRVIDLRKITQHPKRNLSLDWIYSNENYNLANVDEQCTTQDIEQVSVSKNSEFWQPLDEMRSPDLPVHIQEHSSEHGRDSTTDIKQSLGPARNVMERLGPAQNIKKRARHLSKCVKHRSQVKKKYSRPARNGCISLPCSTSHKQNKFTGRNLYDFDKGVYVQGDDNLEIEMKNSKTDPPEHSEHFERLVHSAFLKFVKALNENTAQQRKFTEQGGKCTLKCSVCCRNSEEFVDTLSLVQHAFYYKRVGVRTEHLGFHRALCVLMGWNYAATPNGLWVPRVLSKAEALDLKQDLIIWPPVFFIHNSSIADSNPDKQIIVSIEELGSIIRGMGFGRAVTKVCRGKAANQSTMVVSFHGTFSGLQEAEMLHKLYAENKHGRAEFEQITSLSSSSGDKTRNADQIESVLYGYLGIAEDLIKLDFEAKRRCFVKSKKEILAIVDTPFESE